MASKRLLGEVQRWRLWHRNLATSHELPPHSGHLGILTSHNPHTPVQTSWHLDILRSIRCPPTNLDILTSWHFTGHKMSTDKPGHLDILGGGQPSAGRWGWGAWLVSHGPWFTNMVYKLRVAFECVQIHHEWTQEVQICIKTRSVLSFSVLFCSCHGCQNRLKSSENQSKLHRENMHFGVARVKCWFRMPIYHIGVPNRFRPRPTVSAR